MHFCVCVCACVCVVRSIVALNPALLFWKMLDCVFLPAISGPYSLVFSPLINTALLLGEPTLPAGWVKISTYLQSEPFLSIIFILISLKRLIISVRNRNVLCYVVLRYGVLVTSLHLYFVCLFFLH
jgi:hypothetical protein